MKKKRNIGGIIIYLVLIAVLIFSIIAIFNNFNKSNKYTYNQMVEDFMQNKVYGYEYNLNNDKMTVILKDENGNEYTRTCKFTVIEYHWFFAPYHGNGDWAEIQYENEKNTDWHLSDPNSYTIVAPSSFNWSSLLSYLPFVILIGLVVIFMVYSMRQAGGGKMGGFGKSKARNVTDGDKRVTFSDVAGADEEKEELTECVEYLKNPSKFTRLGAKIPHGVLLVGPPGTGKTLLAKAVAGEAGVPFYSMSGSDFVEMYVGVGASRVRDLFDNARKSPAAIIFIDEIDAVGRQRGAGLGGGNDEREQTLNQLLVQMDGFEGNEGIIVIAATNRSDVLDPALLRPGRFDRQIVVNPPDVKGREKILEVHARKKPMDESVDFKTIARLTSGFTGADLENLLNEAAILTARAGRKKITITDIQEGINKVIMGPQKKSRVTTEEDKKITAFHEAGHAIIGKVLEHCDVVQEVSIIPRGMAAGYTISRPEKDENHMSYSKLMDTITMMLGGRVAEECLLKDICTGASNDIERVTKIARKMVTEWGMSKTLGPINFASSSEVFIGRDYQTQVNYSEKVAADIDAEVKKIVDECYARAKKIIMDNAKKINVMVEVLLEKETIYIEEVSMIMEGKSKEEIIKKMEDDENQNKQKAEREKAEADLEKVKKDKTARIKTAEALRNAGVITEEEVEKVKNECNRAIAEAEAVLDELQKHQQDKKEKEIVTKKEDVVKEEKKPELKTEKPKTTRTKKVDGDKDNKND